MKKIIFQFLLVVAFCSTTYSQQNTLNPNLLTFPVSPEASRLGTFGEIPVNLFYGRLEKNIELFNGNVGDFNLPIQLSYNYGGNRLEETPSIIGLGWQLNLGGVVSREVRGLPDEHPRGYNNAAIKDVLNNYSISGNMSQNDAENFAKGYYDSEADKYSLSVNGIHFSFKIGIDGNPAFLSKHDYKLQIIKNPADNQIIESFILTDTSANQYFFENKEINEPYTGYSAFFEEGFPTYVSSWQLSKIVLNNQKEIFFNYDDNDFISYSFYANIELRTNANDIYSQGCTSDIIKRKILKSISCTNFKVNFDYTKINNHEVYNKMIVQDMNGKIVDSYSFSYSGRRNFLDNIVKNNIFFYGFDYYINSYFPDFIKSRFDYPNNQDEWGFTNAAHNNFPIFVYKSGTYNADKTPDFEYTRNGALKTVKYPTGGRTEIAYEQNLISGFNNETNNPNVRINLKFKSDFSADAPSSKESVFTKTFNSDVVATLSHYNGNVNFIDMIINRTTGDPITGIYPEDHTTAYYLLAPQFRVQGNQIPRMFLQLNEMSQIDSNCLSFNNCAVSRDSSGKFIIPAGTYEFKIRTDYNKTQNLDAEIKLEFYDYDVSQYTQDLPKTALGGLRVRKTIDYPVEGEPITRNYDYTDSEGISSGTPFNNSDLSYSILSKETCCADNVGPHVQIPFVIPTVPSLKTISSTAHNLSLQNNSPVGYTAVKEFTTRIESIKTERFLCKNCTGNTSVNWDDTVVYSYMGGTYGTKKMIYPQGYKMTRFFAPKLKFTDFPYTPMGTDLSIGLQESNIVYGNNTISTNNKKLFEDISACFDTDYRPESESIVNNLNYPKSLKVAFKVRITDRSHITLPWTVNDFFYFKFYKEFDVERFVEIKKNTEYYNDKPLYKTVTIEFDSHYKQKKITTSFNTGDITTNEIFYPYDFTDYDSQDMVNKNYISPIVQIINKKNGEITDSYKYQFSSVSNNLFKPKSFSKSKNNNPFEKRNSYGYDLDGNVNFVGLVTTDNTIPRLITTSFNTSVIWGYNRSQVVAKIESAIPIVIPPNLITAIENASSKTGNETSLLSALTALRNDPAMTNNMVTTYTYIPLVGISTMTDPKGLVNFYEYDELNRLKYIKDKELNILEVYRYNYKGQIIFTNTAQSKTFVKKECATGAIGSSIDYIVAAGIYTSMISQADANAKALADIEANGQDNANSTGTCIYKSNALSGWFSKNNCVGVGVGSSVYFSQMAGVETSTISQADADSKGLILFNTNGHANANASGNCTFSNSSISVSVTKKNCDEGGVGSEVVYTVPAGRYYSTDSQEAADALAQTDVTNNAQANANTINNGFCTFSSVVITKPYTKKDCPSGSVGNPLYYTVPAGQYKSTNSQWEANYYATQRCDNFGQNIANNNGTCTFYNTIKSGIFVKNNCVTGNGSAVTYTVSAGIHPSTTSQADADNRAQNDVNENGQNYANANGVCGFYNFRTSREFTRQCGIGYIGSTVTYLVFEGTYFSTVNQKAANLMGMDDVNANGQNYANTVGTCTYDNH